MKTTSSIPLLALIASSLAPEAAFGITHDDSEYIIPEFFIMFKGDGVHSPTLTVKFDAYQEWNGSAFQEYVETTGTLTGQVSTWSSNTLMISKGMPLDVAGTLSVEGTFISEYKIFINTPDTKYVPSAWAQINTDLYLVSERYVISNRVSQFPLPHTNYIMFKRAGEAGELPGKASSAMPGWRNYKMSLGYGKTGKSLGYVNFWNGNTMKLADTSLEISTSLFTNAQGVVHCVLNTPAMAFDVYYDGTYQEPNFADGAFVLGGYDNDSGQFVTSHILNYAGPAELNNQQKSKTKIQRREGNLTMVSEAHRQFDANNGSYHVSCTLASCTSLSDGFGGSFVWCSPPFCSRVWDRLPSGTVKDFAYDWIISSSAGNPRNCKFSIDTTVLDTTTGNPMFRSNDVAVGLGVAGNFTLTQTDSRRREEFTAWHDLVSGQKRSFWNTVTNKIDTSTGGGAVQYLTGTNQYYWTTGMVAGSGGHLKLKSRMEQDGSWTFYEYYDDFDTRGMVHWVIKPFRDAPAGPPTTNTAALPGSVMTEYTYTNNWDMSKTLPLDIVTKIKGISGANDTNIALTHFEYDFNNEAYANMRLHVTKRYDYFGPGPNDRTTNITKRFRSDTVRAFANLPLSEQRPDGTKTVWSYDAGRLDANLNFSIPYGWTPALVLNNLWQLQYADAAVREWKIACFPADAPGAVDLGIDVVGGSYVVPNRSTAEVRIRDEFGRLRELATFINQGGTNFAYVDRERYYYDPAGNLVFSYNVNTGQITYEATYQDGRKISETDRNGLAKQFFYDDYGQVVRVVETQATGITGLNNPPALQTIYTYDCDNRITSTSVGPPTGNNTPDPNALVTSTIYTRTGWPDTETRPGSYQAKYDYSHLASWRQVTKTEKGLNGATAYDRTTMTTNWLDGRLKSTSGTAVVPSYQDLSVLNIGGQTMTWGGE